MNLPLQQSLRETTVPLSLNQAFGETGQLGAELWSEQFLNHLNDRLHNSLGAVSLQIEQLEQILVDELSQALTGEVVAIFHADRTGSTYKIRHVTQGSVHLSPVICLRHAGLEAGNTLNAEDLKQLRDLEWQNAWELADQHGAHAWLVTAPLSTTNPIHENLVQLRRQCVDRAIVQTMQAIRQAEKVLSLQQQCQQLQAQKQELAQISQLKSEFLANTSHEIRTPLSSILGFTHLLREQGYDPSKVRHQEYLKIILSSGQHLLALINDILDLSKIEANQLTLQQERVDVCEVCKMALKLVHEKASDKGLALKLNVAAEVSTLVADPLRLKQMLFNLLSNAIKFTSRGSIGLEVKLIDPELHFTVWDTGTGISKNQLDLLFRPYKQLANAAHGEGTGLGLALTQKLAEMHGGAVRVESELNQGSRFTIVLPLQTHEPEPFQQVEGVTSQSAPISTAAKRATNSSRLHSILLVEDNTHNARFLTTYLRKLGYTVTLVNNSHEMWKSLKQSLPALILMDINLPGADGLTLTQQLRAMKRYRSIPIIVQTAMAMKGDREKCLAAGATDYISKPIDLANLAQTIAKYSQKKAKG